MPKKKMRNDTKISWICIVLVALAVLIGLIIYPWAATNWKSLLQFKEQIYALISKTIDTIWVSVAVALRKAWENGKNPINDNEVK